MKIYKHSHYSGKSVHIVKEVTLSFPGPFEGVHGVLQQEHCIDFCKKGIVTMKADLASQGLYLSFPEGTVDCKSLREKLW